MLLGFKNETWSKMTKKSTDVLEKYGKILFTTQQCTQKKKGKVNFITFLITWEAQEWMLSHEA